MSTATNAITTCVDVQADLDTLFPTCGDIAPEGFISLTPYLYSAQNRSGIEFIVSPTFAKTRELIAIYDQIIPASEVTTVSDCTSTCTATTVRGDLSTAYVMDCDGFQVEEKFDPADWRLSCTDNATKINRTILKMMAALDTKFNRSIVSETHALIGNWSTYVPATGEALVVRTRVASAETAAPMPNTYVKIQNAQRLTKYCRPAFVVGGMDLWEYAQLMASGCCNDGGLDLGDLQRRFGVAYDFDSDIQDAHGTQISFSLMNGAVQLLTLNMNGGSEQRIPYIDVTGGSTSFAGIMESPWTGLPYDLNIKFDCNIIHMVMTGRVKAVGMPRDRFPAGNANDNVTFANIIQVNNA